MADKTPEYSVTDLQDKYRKRPKVTARDRADAASEAGKTLAAMPRSKSSFSGPHTPTREYSGPPVNIGDAPPPQPVRDYIGPPWAGKQQDPSLTGYMYDRLIGGMSPDQATRASGTRITRGKGGGGGP